MNNAIINGIRIFCFSTREELIQYVNEEKKSLIAINADKILHASDETKTIINNNIGYPDGIGAVLALRKKGFKDAVKIPGVELWLDIINTFHKNRSFFLIGAKEDIIRQTVEKLKILYPGIQILGYRNGYINSDFAKEELSHKIVSLKPDIVFVAMGSPKQELLIEELQKHHSAIYQGLGGSFDVFTGNVKRAPSWWIRNNLEGAYRLIRQPFKIKRYIKALPFWWNLLIGKYN